MPIEFVNIDDQDRPYSQAIRVGDLVYTSGASIGDPDDDIHTQTTKTIEYLSDILQRAGTDLQHVIKASVFLADIAEWSRFNAVWTQYFPANKPVRTTTQTGRFSGHTRVEIDFIAAVPEG